MFQKLILMIVVCAFFSGCSIYYSPHGGHKGKGRGGVVIEVPPTKKPEVKPIPET